MTTTRALAVCIQAASFKLLLLFLLHQDDAELVTGANFTGPWPKVPADADVVLLRFSTVTESEPVCEETSIRVRAESRTHLHQARLFVVPNLLHPPACPPLTQRATWGFGMVGYLVSRKGAERLVAGAARGFAGPADGHIWRQQVYTMDRDWVTHYTCENPCPRSIRTYLNNELGPNAAQPD